MIIKTNSPDELRTVIVGLKKAGITQVTNAIIPDWIAGDNFVEVKKEFGIWAFCSKEHAEILGYETFNTLDKWKQSKINQSDFLHKRAMDWTVKNGGWSTIK